MQPVAKVEASHGGNRLLLMMLVLTAIVNALFLNNDFWQDELYTLKHFVFVPFQTTLTDYHSTNNHIIFNLLMSLYVKVGAIDYKFALQNPWVLRLVPYTLTLFGVFVFNRLSALNFDSQFAKIATIIYGTSLQIYTFGVQCRGYSLELSLVSGLLLLSLYLINHRNIFLSIVLAIVGFLSMLNLPSTLYYYVSLIILVLLTFRMNAFVSIVIPLSVGLFLAAVYIYFVIGTDQLSGNYWIYPKSFRLWPLIRQPFAVIYKLIDFRVHLPVMIILGVTVFYKRAFATHTFSVFLILQLILPFLFFASHNPEIVTRIWIVLLPGFSLLTAHLVLPLIRLDGRFEKFFLPVGVCSLVLSLGFLCWQSLEFNRRNVVQLELRNQYHLFGFHPRDALRNAFKIADSTNSQVRICQDFPGGLDFYFCLFDSGVVNAGKPGVDKIVVVANGNECIDDLTIPAKSNLKQLSGNGEFYKIYKTE